MINICDLKMSVDLLVKDLKVGSVGSVDITIKNKTLYVCQVCYCNEKIFLNDFISLLLEEISLIKQKFKCNHINYSLLANSKNICKNDILDYIVNLYY